MVGTIVIDGLFAAIAAIGFGAISNPPRRAFLSIAIAAAIGHALRFSLMHYVGVDIITASFCASFVIGWVSLFLGSLIYCPMTVVYIPALLPMIPGMYAYKTVFALLLFSRNLSDSDMVQRYMQEFFCQRNHYLRSYFHAGGRGDVAFYLVPIEALFAYPS